MAGQMPPSGTSFKFQWPWRRPPSSALQRPHPPPQDFRSRCSQTYGKCLEPERASFYKSFLPTSTVSSAEARNVAMQASCGREAERCLPAMVCSLTWRRGQAWLCKSLPRDEKQQRNAALHLAQSKRPDSAC